MATKPPTVVDLTWVDNLAFAESLGLTTIRQPFAEIGAAAVAAMLERLKRPDMPGRDILLNFKLIPRKSCCRDGNP